MNDGIPNFLHVLFSPYMVYHDWSHIFLHVWPSFCSRVVDDLRDGQVISDGQYDAITNICSRLKITTAAHLLLLYISIDTLCLSTILNFGSKFFLSTQVFQPDIFLPKIVLDSKFCLTKKI